MTLKNWHLTEMMANHYGIEIDPKDSYESRIRVALHLDNIGLMPEAVETMTATPVNELDGLQLMGYSLVKGNDPERFYRGFPDPDA